MNVNTATSTASTSATAASDTKKKTDVDYQSFLKLLVAQMKNQDPTSPMDATQYVSQLATFSNVEQAVQMNTKLDQMMQSSALAQADTIIGRTLTSADGKVSGVVAEARLTSTGVTAVLKDGSTIAVGAGVTMSPGAA